MEIRKSVTQSFDRLTKRHLPEYALQFFDVKKAQFETLPKPDTKVAISLRHYQDAERIIEIERVNLTWSDIILLDLSIANLLTFENLRFEVAGLRHRFDDFAMTLALGLPKLESIKESEIALLRSEAEALILQLWQFRIARNSRDRYVGELRGTVFWGMLTIMLILIGIGQFIGDTPLYFIILLSGMSGALISILRRLQSAAESIEVNLDQSRDLSALAYEKRAILISLIAGGVFAIVLYLLFRAGLSQLSGELAPKFSEDPISKPASEGISFRGFVNNTGPASGTDYAKVVIWSFAAGFFEQLVPDVLDRLVKRNQGLKR